MEASRDLAKTSMKLQSSSSDKCAHDLISNLPESLLRHILDFLPTKDAVKTGILSKRWRYFWTSISNLDFHKQYDSPVSVDDFIRSVNGSVLLHEGSKIHRFSLKLRYDQLYACYVNQWIHFATKSDVKVVCLELEPVGCWEQYKLPTSIFSCESLTELRLSHCGVDSPPGMVRWLSLKKLDLTVVSLSNDCLDDILSASPSLEDLILNSCSDLGPLSICAPSIKRFSLTTFDCVIGISAPNLKELILVEVELTDDSLDEILSGLPLLEDLTVSYGVGPNPNPERISCPRIRSLTLGYFDSVEEISAADLVSLRIDGIIPEFNCSLMHLSSVAELKLMFEPHVLLDVYDVDWWFEQLTEVLEDLHHVNKLVLSCCCIEIFSTWELQNLPLPFSMCKFMTLHLSMHKWVLPGIVAIMRSSPYLENLAVDIRSMDPPFFGDKYVERHDFNETLFWESHKSSLTCLHHLKSVTINDFWGSYGTSGIRSAMVENFLKRQTDKLILAAFLLKSALVLREITVFISTKDLNFEKVEDKQQVLSVIAKEISGFPKGPSGAAVSFLYI